jgi:UDP-glucose 4-epimerase
MTTLVVGRGLLGQAVMRATSPSRRLHPYGQIDWRSPPAARRQLTELGRQFGSNITGPWTLAWCAGSGVVGTSSQQLADEESYLASFLESLAASTPSSARTLGRLFFASSAGGVFGLGNSEPLSEFSVESPISDYGYSKLAQEGMVLEWALETGVTALVGRLSNLYGAGQNLAKSQGFISQLLRTMLIRRPFVLSVSGDTQRDFIHVDDAAQRIEAWLTDPGATGVVRKLIVDGRSHTLSWVTHVVRSITHVQPKVVHAVTAAGALQPRHLRFVSQVAVHLDAENPCRPIDVGISQTWNAMLRQFAYGTLI